MMQGNVPNPVKFLGAMRQPNEHIDVQLSDGAREVRRVASESFARMLNAFEHIPGVTTEEAILRRLYIDVIMQAVYGSVLTYMKFPKYNLALCETWDLEEHASLRQTVSGFDILKYEHGQSSTLAATYNKAYVCIVFVSLLMLLALF